MVILEKSKSDFTAGTVPVLFKRFRIVSASSVLSKVLESRAGGGGRSPLVRYSESPRHNWSLPTATKGGLNFVANFYRDPEPRARERHMVR